MYHDKKLGGNNIKKEELKVSARKVNLMGCLCHTTKKRTLANRLIFP